MQQNVKEEQATKITLADKQLILILLFTIYFRKKVQQISTPLQLLFT